MCIPFASCVPMRILIKFEYCIYAQRDYAAPDVTKMGEGGIQMKTKQGSIYFIIRRMRETRGQTHSQVHNENCFDEVGVFAYKIYLLSVLIALSLSVIQYINRRAISNSVNYNFHYNVWWNICESTLQLYSALSQYIQEYTFPSIGLHPIPPFLIPHLLYPWNIVRVQSKIMSSEGKLNLMLALWELTRLDGGYTNWCLWNSNGW